MANELHSKSLKELRVLYPGIKSTSQKGFLEQIPSEGLGDTIEKVLESPVLKPITKAVKKIIFKDGDDCGCKERKLKLNKLFKYKYKPRCFTEEEYKQWGKFKTELEAKSSLRIENDEIKYICTTFSSIMNRQY